MVKHFLEVTYNIFRPSVTTSRYTAIQTLDLKTLLKVERHKGTEAEGFWTFAFPLCLCNFVPMCLKLIVIYLFVISAYSLPLKSKCLRPVAQAYFFITSLPEELCCSLCSQLNLTRARHRAFLGATRKVPAGSRLKDTFRRTMLLTSVRNETVRAV